MKTRIAVMGFALAGMFSASAFAADAAQVARGKATYENWCATCHAGGPVEGGRLLPGTSSLLMKYKGQRPGALDERTDLLAPYIQVIVRQGTGGMPFFRKTEVSNKELDDIAAYLTRNVKAP